jgi:hypothetical protein
MSFERYPKRVERVVVRMLVEDAKQSFGVVAGQPQLVLCRVNELETCHVHEAYAAARLSNYPTWPFRVPNVG